MQIGLKCKSNRKQDKPRGLVRYQSKDTINSSAPCLGDGTTICLLIAPNKREKKRNEKKKWGGRQGGINSYPMAVAPQDATL